MQRQDAQQIIEDVNRNPATEIKSTIRINVLMSMKMYDARKRRGQPGYSDNFQRTQPVIAD